MQQQQHEPWVMDDRMGDLTANLEAGAGTLTAVYRLLASARDGLSLPAADMRVLLEPAMDSVQQALDLAQALQALQAPENAPA